MSIVPFRNILFTLSWVFVAVFTGCCPCPKSGFDPRNPPPPPISLDEQVSRLTQWSHQIPYLHANTVPLGVRLDYRDENGSSHSQNAEGTLVFLQPFANVPQPPQKGNVLLLGTAVNQPVFEAGRNDTQWWFLIRLDTKTAWVGDSTRPVDLFSLGQKQSRSMLRADIVLDLLALSDLPAYAAPLNARGQFVVMKVNDFDATNDLFIEQIGPDGRPVIARQIIIDRYTDQVREVRIYDPNGILVVRSQLTDYVPVNYPEGEEKPAHPPKFPRKVAVSYPVQNMAVVLEFDSSDLTLKRVRPAAFQSPDWEKEGLHKIVVD